MKINELIERTARDDTVIVDPAVTLSAAAELLVEYRIGALPVVDGEDRLVGILSERDIVAHITNDRDSFSTISVGEVMSQSPITCAPDDDVQAVSSKLIENRIRHIPVTRDDELVTILSIRDLITVMSVSPDL